MAGTKKSKKFLRKWGLVIVGVCMTIASAVITNYIIEQNNDEISEWERESVNLAQQIEDIWENNNSLERRKDTAVLLLVSAPDNPQTKQFVLDTLFMLKSSAHSNFSYELLQESFELYKEDVIERINDKFLIRQTYLDRIQSAKMKNDVLINIALCFQILGLILVLTRGID